MFSVFKTELQTVYRYAELVVCYLTMLYATE